MMKNQFLKKIIIFVTTLIVFSNISLVANANGGINFNNITIEDGLTQSTVSTIIQDKKGYIWIGTNDGLNRYNGNEFKVFRHDKNNKDSIVNSYIEVLKEDLEGNIWVGTVGGVSKISSTGKIIKNYTENNGGLSHYNVGDILVTKDGSILITTDDGVNLYNEKTDSFDRILKSELISSQIIYSIEEDDNGDIWLGTSEGLNKVNVKNKTVDKFLIEKDTPKIDNSVNKVYCDSNYIWIGTSSKGAFRLNVDTNEIEDVFKDFTEEERPGETVRDIYNDSRGMTWIGTNNGLVKIGEKEGELSIYKNKAYDKKSLVNDSVYSIFEDKSGILWIGTYAGISYFELNNKIQHYYHDPFDSSTINDNMINAIYKDDTGYLWVGTNSKGISILDSEMKNIENLTTYNTKALTGNTVRDITGYKENIFIGTNNGLVWINKKNDELLVLNSDSGLECEDIRNLYVDNRERLLIGTKNGYYILNINTSEVEDLNYIFDNNNIKDKFSGAIFQDSGGDYWIGSFINGGLLRINTDTGFIKVYKYEEGNKNSIIDNSIRAIEEDSKGNIWVGTSEGLCKINKKTDEITRYTTDNGLANNTIYGILIDEKDNIWVSTNSGISKLDSVTNSFSNFNMLDGLQSNEFNGEAYLEDNEGIFYFGGINGLNVFNPMEVSKQLGITEVMFDGFTVNGIAVESINNKTFKYDENNIRIKMFLPDYKNNKNTRMYYNISGKSDEWIPINDREVLFSNLAPGNYTFKVAAVNNQGSVSNVNEINFVISRIFWLSLPAFILYIIIIVFIVVYHKYKVKVLDKRVEESTRELRGQMEENSNLYEKIIKLEKNKNSYFINLSHELRTPLNVASTTEQLITKLNSQGEISRDKLDYYMNILRNNNKRLLNLINNLIDISKIEHGKYIIKKEEVDIVYLVEETALSLKEYIEHKGIELVIDPEIEEKRIFCDPGDIERCIINLISNAVKFTSEGGVITIGLKEDEDIVKISVKDTGIGISEDFKDVIFDRFNQVVDKASEVKGGSGLGLTITRQIVDLHKGKIYIESKIGKGSKFIIELPVK